MTEGESGITGQSIAVIFEFPKEERRGRRIKYVPVGDTNGQALSCGLGVSIANCVFGKVAAASGSQADIAAALQQFNREVHPQLDWPATAREYARAICRIRHDTPHVRRVTIATDIAGEGVSSLVVPTDDRFQIEFGSPNYVYQSRPWTATCVKKVKGPRR